MKIIAIKERAEGNESVGTMWVETAVFDEKSTLGDVMKWAGVQVHATKYGKLMLSLADEPEGSLLEGTPR